MSESAVETSAEVRPFQLEDRHGATTGRVLLTGVQAVCRVPVDVRRWDLRAGLNTRAFVS